MTGGEPPARSAYLGAFDEFEGRIVVEILQDRGISAFLKHDPSQAEYAPYPVMSDRGVVLVDADHLVEARRIVTQDLPAHLEGIRRAMAVLEDRSPPDGEAPENGYSQSADLD